MVELPDHMEETALSRLFLGPKRSPEAAWFSLPGGRVLFHAGEEPDRLYFLVAGRLGAVQRTAGQEPQFLGVIRPGEPAGEMAMVAGTPHTASVVALRDSELMAIPREDFLKAADKDPAVMAELAHLMILRARRTGGAPAGEPAVFGFIGLCPGAPVRELVDQLQARIAGLGYSVATAGAEVQSAPTEWFSNLEDRHDVVLYAAAYEETHWKTIVGRQVDQLFCVCLGDEPPGDRPLLHAAPPLVEQRLVDLVLVHGAGQKPSGADAWMDAAPLARLFHLRKGDQGDLARLTRVIVGQSVGLVLSGGGARAYAHIGAVKALREAGVPIDFLGGVSMGAIIAAGVALGWDDEELDWRIRKAFVESSPLDDIAFPMIAMTHGRKVRARMAEHFGDAEIADLGLPFFCVSTDLTTGTYRIHRRGLVREALRASIALPGILPPYVADDGHVLVDGAVTKNFPTDVMRTDHRGPIIGIDVGEAKGLTAADVQPPRSIWRWLASGDWRRGPPVVSVLMRSATIMTAHEFSAAREYADVLISPDVGAVEIRDWKAYGPAVEAGYRATAEILSKLDRPVTELRRRIPRRELSGRRLAVAQ